MKVLAILIVILYQFNSTIAQNQTGAVLYEFQFPIDSVNDLVTNSILTFNDSESLFTYRKLGLDSNEYTESKMLFSKSGSRIYVSKYDSIGTIVYRNFLTKEIRERQPKYNPFSPYIVQDDWFEIKWEKQNNFKQILGHNCQLAKGDFRGRTYLVWFTDSIPYQYGPYKLFGLSGLILEGVDATNTVFFKAKDICYPCDDSIIILPPVEKEIKNIKESVLFNDYFIDNLAQELNKSEVAVSKGLSIEPQTKMTKDAVLRNRQYQIEVIYNWESDPYSKNINLNKD